jgi:tRNA threonylcarbamoyladenosine biosynthesis protein TsaE
MATLISRSPEETVAFGERYGREAQHGWVIGLTGDLGAGKTQIVKGIARGLGSPARVHSPTFALLHEYGGGRVPLFHLDLYRLNNPQEIAAAGLEEYLLTPSGVSVVEWIDRWVSELQGLGTVMRLIRIEVLNESERRITYEDSGA